MSAYDDATAQYRSGDGYALVGTAAVVLVAADTPIDRVHALWERIDEPTGLAGLVETLAGPGASFAAIPDFAAALFEDGGVRLVARGPLRAHAVHASGSEDISGADVTTWSERFLAGVTTVELSVSDAAAAVELPVCGGVVRAAAVRRGRVESVAVPAPVAQPALVEPEPVAEPVPVADPAPVLVSEPAPEPEPVPEPDLTPEPVEAPGVDADPVSDHTLIPTETVVPEEIRSDEAATDIDEFEMLFGDTVHVAPRREAPAPATGDHDGATISLAQARALRQAPPAVGADAPTAVLPVVGTGRVRLSTGQEVALDRSVIIGRRPRSPRASGADLPHLVAVESPNQDISRNHLEIRPEGDAVVVIDLHTTNGSTLLRPGNDPVKLHPGEQTLVLTGDAIDLGDGVVATFQELP